MHPFINGIGKFICLSILLLFIASCGGGGGDSEGFVGDPDPEDPEDPVDPGDPAVPEVSDIRLLVSSPQIASSGADIVTLTAVVRDENNVVVEGVPVGFSTDDGDIRVVQAVTDDTGTAEAIFEVGENQANRTATVTASASGLEDSVTINVVGTSVAISGPTSGTLRVPVSYTLTLQDSAGDGIAGEALEVTSAQGADINPPSPVTDASGQATVTITPNAAGTDTITVTGANATATQTLVVSPDQFVFIQPEPAEIQDVPLNTLFPVTVRWTAFGEPVVGQSINFSATRGELTPSVAITNGLGEATVNIQANSAGPSIITASDLGGGPSAQVEILFVATVADELNLQASPATIGTNPPGSAGEQSTITAIVRDPNNNPVKGKIINFSLEDVTGGSIFPSSAITDEFGRASTVYTSGNVPSAENAVTISAQVADRPSVDDFVNLTVARRELFITLGTGNELIELDPTRYQLPYSVLVNDAVGGPATNARVTLDVIPNAYFKGFYTFNGTIWVPTITAGPCINEDIDRDGILDPGEDINNNNRLDPGNVATVSPPSTTTGEDGFALFDVLYAQQFANWVDVNLVAEARVAGTEAEEVSSFVLPVLSDDINQEDVAPPGSPSPFGNSTSCATELLLLANPAQLIGQEGDELEVQLTLLDTSPPQPVPLANVPIVATSNAAIDDPDADNPPPFVDIIPSRGTTDQNGRFTSVIEIIDSPSTSEETVTVRYRVPGAFTEITIIVTQ